MARKSLSVVIGIKDGGEERDMLRLSSDGEVVFFLPETDKKAVEKKMSARISQEMSRFVSAHPESTLLSSIRRKEMKIA